MNKVSLLIIFGKSRGFREVFSEHVYVIRCCSSEWRSAETAAVKDDLRVNYGHGVSPLGVDHNHVHEERKKISFTGQR